MARTKSAGSWEQYSLKQMAALKECDLKTQAPALGLPLDEAGRVRVNFFGRDYLIANDDISALDGQPVSYNHKSALAHYLASQGRGELSGEFLPICRLTGVVHTGSSPSGNLIQPLTDRFGDKYEAFAEAAAKRGGVHEGRSPAGGESWHFQPLPYLPIKVIFFEADDEFEAEVKALFDSSAPVFMSYECLELVEMLMVAELLGAAGLLGCGGHQHD